MVKVCACVVVLQHNQLVCSADLRLLVCVLLCVSVHGAAVAEGNLLSGSSDTAAWSRCVLQVVWLCSYALLMCVCWLASVRECAWCCSG
jgi:hypothetical protein